MAVSRTFHVVKENWKAWGAGLSEKTRTWRKGGGKVGGERNKNEKKTDVLNRDDRVSPRFTMTQTLADESGPIVFGNCFHIFSGGIREKKTSTIPYLPGEMKGKWKRTDGRASAASSASSLSGECRCHVIFQQISIFLATGLCFSMWHSVPVA